MMISFVAVMVVPSCGPWCVWGAAAKADRYEGSAAFDL